MRPKTKFNPTSPEKPEVDWVPKYLGQLSDHWPH